MIVHSREYLLLNIFFANILTKIDESIMNITQYIMDNEMGTLPVNSSIVLHMC